MASLGPSSFYPEDWTNYGFDQEGEDVKAAAAGLFSVMAGREITPDMFGTPEYHSVTITEQQLRSWSVPFMQNRLVSTALMAAMAKQKRKS